MGEDHNETPHNGSGVGPTRARRIALLLEVTQATIGLSVTGVTLYVAARLAFIEDGGTAAQLLLSNAFFLVIGYYFGRQETRGKRAADADHPP